jgi:hypothetical protein
VKINTIIWEKVTIKGLTKEKVWTIPNCMINIRDKFGSFEEVIRGTFCEHSQYLTLGHVEIIELTTWGMKAKGKKYDATIDPVSLNTSLDTYDVEIIAEF